MTPLLSVLICAIPSRTWHLGLPLFERISKQCEDERLEVLLLLDNKRRTVGAKRNAILGTAKGRFVVQIDDDDDLASDAIPRILSAIEAESDADLFVYDTLCSLDDEHPPQIVRSGVELDITQYSHDSGADRKPVQTMCWRRELAQSAQFSDKQWGEDTDWAQQLWPKVKKQVRIGGEPLYRYQWREWRTEAK